MYNGPSPRPTHSYENMNTMNEIRQRWHVYISILNKEKETLESA